IRLWYCLCQDLGDRGTCLDSNRCGLSDFSKESYPGSHGRLGTEVIEGEKKVFARQIRGPDLRAGESGAVQKAAPPHTPIDVFLRFVFTFRSGVLGLP